MDVIQVAPYFSPHVGGVETHVLTLGQELKRKGHSVTVMTSRYEASLPEREVVDGLDVVRTKTKSVRFSTPVVPDLKKDLLGYDCDIVHSHTPPPLSGYYAARALKGAGTPHVNTYHCDLEIPFVLGPIITRFYELTLGSYTLRHSDAIIVTSKSYGATSRAVWKYEPDIVPNAINVRDFSPDIDGRPVREKHGLEGKKVALYVGRLAFHKGIEYFIESAKHTPEDIYYLIVGGGDKRPDLERLASDLGVGHRVVFAGKVPQRELPRYYAACDTFVLPSVTRLEAFGIVGLEAMATGKPILVSNIPGVTELVTEGVEGLHFKPLSSRDLARALVEVFEDGDRAREMGEAGRRKVEERFNWDNVILQIEEIYGRLLGE